MRKSLYLAVAMVLFVPAVSAQDSLGDWKVDVEMVEIGYPTDKVPWNARLTWLDQSTDTSEGEKVTDISFSREGGEYIATFSGFILNPSPCHGIKPRIQRYGSNYRYIITVSDYGVDDDCPRVQTLVEYDATFRTNEPFMLRVQYEDQFMDLLQHPANSRNNTGDKPDVTETDSVPDSEQTARRDARLTEPGPRDPSSSSSRWDAFKDWLNNLF